MSNKIPALLLVVVLHVSFTSNGQNSYVEMRKTPFRIAGNFTNREDSLQKEFESKGLEWPAKYVYIRSFKYDAQLEVWVKNTAKEKYRLFKTYKVCMQSGTLGPKRLQGDYQVPEGFYYINEFNTHSNYHLALGLNYPNTSDKILSDTFHPGGAIFIHGSCVS
ncbi:MAG: L,D-transpeptidase family protein, partial [Ginsengibacter sp.]